VIKEIGKGSMGVVYQAHDPNLDLTVALKVLRHERVIDDSFVRRFLSEARVLGRLDRANIVRVYNIDEDDGSIYIAMEYIEGESLADVMERKKFAPEEIVQLGITIAKTLDYAHRKGVVHRDIKPTNILIRKDGFLKITDFGIARIQDPEASVKTQAGEILGTPAYMAPEQVLSKPVDGRVDLFSLGIILYELCTGTRPFGGDNIAAIFHAITSKDPLPISRVNPAVPQSFAQIIMKCLRKNPGERFESGKALVKALEGCLVKDKAFVPEAVPRRLFAQKIAFFLVGAILLTGVIAGSVYYATKTKKESGFDVEPLKRAYLKVESTPGGAQVFIDGALQGNTPVTLELVPGKHVVLLKLADFHEWKAPVQLREETRTPLSVSLVPIEE
jgi:serine/threonine protein kinase